MNANTYMEEPGLSEERKAAVEKLERAIADNDGQLEEILWQALILYQNYPFYTAKKLEFSYTIKGNEMFVTRREKSITRATIDISFRKALELGEKATGPKKLGTFGASYLYPVFKQCGVIPLTASKNR